MTLNKPGSSCTGFAYCENVKTDCRDAGAESSQSPRRTQNREAEISYERNKYGSPRFHWSVQSAQPTGHRRRSPLRPWPNRSTQCLTSISLSARLVQKIVRDTSFCRLLQSRPKAPTSGRRIRLPRAPSSHEGGYCLCQFWAG